MKVDEKKRGENSNPKIKISGARVLHVMEISGYRMTKGSL